MLRNYLRGLRRERHFDTPFGLLLSPCGFTDVHYTHGVVEFGKDFIAKRHAGDGTIQYSFQIKRGNISLPEWTDRIQNQMLQSVMTPIRHPSFDRDLKHQAILVTTGEVNPIAAQAIDELNTQIQQQYERLPILIWSENNLLDMIVGQGLDSMLAATVEGFAEYADFYQLYSRAMRGDAAFAEIEADSKRWISQFDDFGKWALWCSLESEALAQQFVASGQLYEAVHVYLGRLRAVCTATYQAPNPELSGLFDSALPQIVELAQAYLSSFNEMWEPSRDLVSSDLAPTDFVCYRVQCSRALEMACLGYWLTEDTAIQEDLVDFMHYFVLSESGAAHPISDRYAVTIAFVALALLKESRNEPLGQLLRQATVWLCDRHEEGFGLATVDADEEEEIETLLGYRFEFTKVSKRHDSLLATVIRDVTVILGEQELFERIGNDFGACEISPEYYQAKNSIGACLIEGDDVLRYPTVRYRDELTDWCALSYSSYIAEECQEFEFTKALGSRSVVVLAMLLRDRYFPGVWTSLLGRRTSH